MLRPAALVVLGAIVGAGVAPAIAAVWPQVQPAAVLTRVASCLGANFYPLDSTTRYGYAASNLRVRKDLTTGSGYFLCDPGLPN